MKSRKKSLRQVPLYRKKVGLLRRHLVLKLLFYLIRFVTVTVIDSSLSTKLNRSDHRRCSNVLVESWSFFCSKANSLLLCYRLQNVLHSNKTYLRSFTKSAISRVLQGGLVFIHCCLGNLLPFASS